VNAYFTGCLFCGDDAYRDRDRHIYRHRTYTDPRLRRPRRSKAWGCCQMILWRCRLSPRQYPALCNRSHTHIDTHTHTHQHRPPTMLLSSQHLRRLNAWRVSLLHNPSRNKFFLSLLLYTDISPHLMNIHQSIPEYRSRCIV